jgi:hypothetical protein
MVETVHKDGSADGFHILLGELTFVASMGQDVCPPAPAKKQITSMEPLIVMWSFILTVRYQQWEIPCQNKQYFTSDDKKATESTRVGCTHVANTVS